MIAEAKMLNFCDLLKKKTIEGNVNWTSFKWQQITYTAELREADFSIFKIEPIAGKDQIVVCLLNKQGIEMGQIESAEGDKNWNVLSSLYDAILNRLYDYDRVADQVEKSLTSSGFIGK
jgi:hypothetical protein